METKIPHFAQTTEALNEIKAALDYLQQTLQNKNTDIIRLKEATNRSISRIDQLIQTLNSSQEKDGSSNNHN